MSTSKSMASFREALLNNVLNLFLSLVHSNKQSFTFSETRIDQLPHHILQFIVWNILCRE